MTDEEKRQKNLERNREYYQKNKDRLNANKRKWIESHYEEHREQQRRWNKKYRKEHIEDIKEYVKKYRREHADVIARNKVHYYEMHREHYQSPEYKEHLKELHKKWYDKNREQIVKNICKYQKEINDKSRENANNNNRRWTQEDIELIKRMLSNGLSSQEMAHALGRTVSSVKNKIRRMRIEEDNND